MKEIQDALLRLVRAGMRTKKIQESYLKNGLDDSDLFQVLGDIADAICILTGEHKSTFEETTTYLALTVPAFDDEHRVRLLMNEYRRNHPEQPKPEFMGRDKMRENVRKVGGYMAPEGDWT